MSQKRKLASFSSIIPSLSSDILEIQAPKNSHASIHLHMSRSAAKLNSLDFRQIVSDDDRFSHDIFAKSAFPPCLFGAQNARGKKYKVTLIPSNIFSHHSTLAQTPFTQVDKMHNMTPLY